jgi:hypothetical protein
LEDQHSTIAFCPEHEVGICQALVDEAAAAGLTKEEAVRSLGRDEPAMAAELGRLIVEQWPQRV